MNIFRRTQIDKALPFIELPLWIIIVILINKFIKVNQVKEELDLQFALSSQILPLIMRLRFITTK